MIASTNPDGSLSLPPREFFGDSAWVIAAAQRNGFDQADIEENPRSWSAAEWRSDVDRAEAIATKHGLSSARCEQLKELFCARNQTVWGPYCDAWD